MSWEHADTCDDILNFLEASLGNKITFLKVPLKDEVHGDDLRKDTLG